MPTKAQLVELLDRALYTFLSSLLAVFVPGVTLTHASWLPALDVAGTAALIQVLISAKTLLGNVLTSPPAAAEEKPGAHQA